MIDASSTGPPETTFVGREMLLVPTVNLDCTSPDGATPAFGSQDNTVRLWDAPR
jgi:WD40 repeat protein